MSNMGLNVSSLEDVNQLWVASHSPMFAIYNANIALLPMQDGGIIRFIKLKNG